SELQARQATLQEALERALTSNERQGLLHKTGSGSRSSRAAAEDEGAATVVEGARASGGHSAQFPAKNFPTHIASTEDATPPTPTRSRPSFSKNRPSPSHAIPAHPPHVFPSPAHAAPPEAPARREAP